MLYGGHILDSGDAEAVRSLCRQCLTTGASLKASSGFANLLAAVRGISNPGEWRLPGWLQTAGGEGRGWLEKAAPA